MASHSHSDILTVQKFDMVCRTCLIQFEAPYQCYSISDQIGEGHLVREVLEIIFNVKASENDQLPQHICSDCHEGLVFVSKFRKKCKHSDRKLHTILYEHKIAQGLRRAVHQNVNKLSKAIQGSAPEEHAQAGEEDFMEEVIQIKVESESLEDEENCQDDVVLEQTDDDDANNDDAEENIEIEAATISEQEAGFETIDEISLCTLCNEGFTNPKSLELHLRSHIRKPSEEDLKKADAMIFEVIEDGAHPEITALNSSQEDIEDRTCNECGKVFMSIYGLECHKPVHDTRVLRKRGRPAAQETEDDRTCRDCGKLFSTRLGLQSHKVRHQKKQFTCEQCGYKFHTKAGLEIHFRSHTGEKPYICNYCNKSFSQQGSLSLHTLTHTGERPHKCHLCPAAFKQGHHLQYHLQSHSGEKPYLCTICKKGFASKRNLIIHARSHTGEKDFICPVCEKGFYDRHGVNKHLKRHIFGGKKDKSKESYITAEFIGDAELSLATTESLE